ncbi:universal stress protein [Nonomuraea jiangxiensis]|uniref:Nucleotide-binding universal stress protein, UspA family n=1 Tax=Nonomuraea jiangxiensis TaxID=633440 RepID=A0A1G9SVY0_9ACTN|nr:universal stress protein [Nonomuraea jiangxiensis]SDM38985.1 Nucleotide-binding universal stress protein, UspA family [Nonomuraea jiangxiensis]
MSDRGGEQPILVGYDESPGSEQALRWAVHEARLRGLPVLVCHAWQWPYPLRPVSEKVLAQVERIATAVVHNGVRHGRELGGVEVRPIMAKGPASAVLLEAAREAALVVLGSRGVGGFEDLRVGSAAVQVPAHSSKPVVVVRPGEPVVRDGARIVVGIDGSPASRAAFDFALEEAALHGGTVRAICGWWDPGALPGPDALPFVDAETMRAGAEARFREVVLLLTSRYPAVPVTTEFVAERPPRAIVEAAKDATLLVLGRGGLDSRSGPVLGVVTQAALTEVHCPVAVTPPPD